MKSLRSLPLTLCGSFILGVIWNHHHIHYRHDNFCNVTYLAIPALFYLRRYYLFHQQMRGWIVLAMVLLFFQLGVYRYQQQKLSSQNNSNTGMPFNQAILLTTTVQGSCQKFSERSQLILKNIQWNERKFSKKILLHLPLTQCFYVDGDQLRLKIRLRPLLAFKNEYTFNLRQYWFNQEVIAQAELVDNQAIEVLQSSKSFVASLLRHRMYWAQFFLQHLPKHSAEFWVALLLGMNLGATSEVNQDFQILGVNHILVVSGMHLGILLWIFHFPLRYLLNFKISWKELGTSYQLSYFISALLTLFYAIYTGMEAPVLRSAVMLLGICCCVVSLGVGNALAILSYSVLLMLFFNPREFLSVSLQLSAWATLGLIILHPYNHWVANKCLPNIKNPILKKMSAGFVYALSCSVLLQLFMYPWLAHYFGRFSLWGPLANLSLNPLLSFVALPLGLMALLFLPKAWAAHFFLQTNFLTEKLLTWIHVWANYDLLYLTVKPLSVMLLSWLLTASSLQITMFDVQQGECMLLRLPNGKNYLLDAGTQFYWSEMASQMLVKILRNKGVHQLEGVIITHGDQDHYNMLSHLTQAINVTHLYVTQTPEDKPLWQEVMLKMHEQQIPMQYLKAEDIINSEKVFIKVLHPQKDLEYTQQNNYSLVLQLCYQKFCGLFTGDVEALGETDFVATLQDQDIDLLKVGHHGSKTSSSEVLLEKIYPLLGIISVGENNRYHLPHPSIVQRLNDKGMMLLRTDQDGQIDLTTDGKQLCAKTYATHKNYCWELL